MQITKNDKKTLETFMSRVKCVDKSCMSPNPAQPIQESEIITALCTLSKILLEQDSSNSKSLVKGT